ncbi:fumarylacetoacetate hydrolase family protein [Calidifontibacter sp. DB0510]|uniref:Fumarylacetoacetate hydrolase family protein n=1 Tax=Metallococcus carri TaxID=1656884 RepID=A0A967E8I2_9MICO|nr:fumarylacetoacetate hydrolase family protein [Metallococcus carri]NHN54225.1 fumarylacetoacetate hydrolase family protein [Metallococcus carri]NOP36935.1 fumarylacetoacetate hydrolase family protein [Calidifontibacter sp. DB2511S]
MKLATVRLDDGRTTAVRIDGETAVRLDYPDVGRLLTLPDWRSVAESARGATLAVIDLSYAPLIPAPGKIACVGLNYRTHIQEMGRDLPRYPTLFTKYAETLVGAHDALRRPVETEAFDWEAELAVIVGAPVRRASESEAAEAIAGFAVFNDVTCRDWQFRTKEWMQGKNWEATSPLGPWLVTPDELPGGTRPALGIRTLVDGELMQQDTTGDLLFDPVDLVSYLSTMVTLVPGDVIATGTPGGVGHARTPARYLTPGQSVITEVDGLGRCENVVVADGGIS